MGWEHDRWPTDPPTGGASGRSPRSSGRRTKFDSLPLPPTPRRRSVCPACSPTRDDCALRVRYHGRDGDGASDDTRRWRTSSLRSRHRRSAPRWDPLQRPVRRQARPLRRGGWGPRGCRCRASPRSSSGRVAPGRPGGARPARERASPSVAEAVERQRREAVLANGRMNIASRRRRGGGKRRPGRGTRGLRPEVGADEDRSSSIRFRWLAENGDRCAVEAIDDARERSWLADRHCAADLGDGLHDPHSAGVEGDVCHKPDRSPLRIPVVARTTHSPWRRSPDSPTARGTSGASRHPTNGRRRTSGPPGWIGCVGGAASESAPTTATRNAR